MWSGSLGSASSTSGLVRACASCSSRLLACASGMGSCQALPCRSVMNNLLMKVLVTRSVRRSYGCHSDTASRSSLMNDTAVNFILAVPITVGASISASVSQTRMTRSSPRASIAARCLPSGERVKLDILGNAASCAIVGGVGVACAGAAARAATSARIRKRIIACLLHRSAGTGYKASRWAQKKNTPPPVEATGCRSQLRTTSECLGDVHEERPADVVVAAVQRSIADAVVDARGDAGRRRVGEVLDARGDFPRVEVVLARDVVGEVVLDVELARIGLAIEAEEVVALHRADPFHAVADLPVLHAVGHVQRARILRVVDRAVDIVQRIIREQLARLLQVVRDLGRGAQGARTDVAHVAQGEVVAADLVRCQVHVAVVHREGVAARGARINQTAEAATGAEVRIVVAQLQDVGGTGARDTVIDLDVEVVDGERDVADALRQLRLQDQADGHVLRRLSLQ